MHGGGNGIDIEIILCVCACAQTQIMRDLLHVVAVVVACGGGRQILAVLVTACECETRKYQYRNNNTIDLCAPLAAEPASIEKSSRVESRVEFGWFVNRVIGIYI